MPRDPSDDKDVILEVKAGEGGEESALFAGDLLRMYLRYAERVGWKTEILDANESDLGGYKDVQVAVKAKRGNARPGEGVWARLKYEGGVHRVQRVPATESQGRIHTSAAGVLVAARGRGRRGRDRPERPADRRLPLVRPRRPVASTPPTPRSASRTCRPASSSSCQNEKSQLQNKESAMRILRARLLAAAQEEADARRPTHGAARSARSTAPSASAPTTSRRTASPTTGWATRPTTSTRCSTATSTRSSRRAWTPTSPPSSPRASDAS